MVKFEVAICHCLKTVDCHQQSLFHLFLSGWSVPFGPLKLFTGYPAFSQNITVWNIFRRTPAPSSSYEKGA